MIPRTARRFSTCATRAKQQQRRDWWEPPSTPPLNPPPPTADQLKAKARRIAKAERDERMDITMALTPVKDYMPGFTRPKDIRTSNWSKGGRYTELKKYESPPAEAYEPHTVYLLESRYIVKQGIGRVDCNEFLVGVCRTGDFPLAMERLNNPNVRSEAMDNARWPFTKPKFVRRNKWWEQGEDPRELRERCLSGEDAGSSNGALSSNDVPQVPTEILPSSSSSSTVTQHRGYHTSARAHAQCSSTTRRDRARMPLSAWSRPPKPSQDARDDVVPAYYIERKRQRDTICERKEEEGSLMAELSAGILSEGVAASTRVFPEKIPVEVKELDGTIRHPSGFEPPTPETDFHPIASKTPNVDHPLLTTFKVSWEEVLSPSSVEEKGIVYSPSSNSRGMRGFHTSAPIRATTVDHPSIHPLPVQPPPVPVSEDVASEAEVESSQTNLLEDLVDEDEGESLLQAYTSKPEPLSIEELEDIREKYSEELKQQPFWRPMLALTFTTRPLALTIARLSKGLERGLPFYASINNDDRKCVSSYSSRMRGMRLKRMHELTMSLAKALAGERGGLLGVRFHQDERPRGSNGAGFEKPIEFEKRMVEVGVGDWYSLAQEVKESFEWDAKEAGIDAFRVYGLDERGLRTDGSSWPEQPGVLRARTLKNQAASDQMWGEMTRKERLRRMNALAEQNMEGAAKEAARKHRSVYYPR